MQQKNLIVQTKNLTVQTKSLIVRTKNLTVRTKNLTADKKLNHSDKKLGHLTKKTSTGRSTNKLGQYALAQFAGQLVFGPDFFTHFSNKFVINPI